MNASRGHRGLLSDAATRFALALLFAGCTSAVGQNVSARDAAQGTPAATNASTAIGGPQTVQGTLLIVWGDPQPGSSTGGETRYSLALADGSVLPLQLMGLENLAVSYFNEAVIVTGWLAAASPQVTGNQATQTFLVDTITPVVQHKAYSNRAKDAVGTRRAIYLLVKFADDAAVPHPPAFYADLNNPDTPPAGEVFPTTVNGFFKKTSWNQLSWQADVGGAGGVGASGGWLTLPYPKSHYANCGWSDSCADLNALAADATALGKAQGIVFTTYDVINFVLSNDLDCCAWGGGYGLDGKQYGATWEPPWGQETGTYAHELGHSLGLPHSGWVYYAYDSPWDVMSARTSARSAQCGSYMSANSGNMANVYCDEPGDGYIAAHKEFLGWIPSSNIVLTDSVTNVTADLEGAALPLSSAAKMMKICITTEPCTGSTAHYFTIEARVDGLGGGSQYDNGIAGAGVIIHDVKRNRSAISGKCFFNDQSGWALPIDSTAGDYNAVDCDAGGRIYPNWGLFNAQFNPGQTYINVTYRFGINVLARAGSLFSIAMFVPPAVTTTAATGVTSNTAILNGIASSHGATTLVDFRYGPTTAYGSTATASQSPLPGAASNTAVSSSLAGLTCNTTYHFQVRGTNSAGAVIGSDSTFATAVCSSNANLANLVLSTGTLQPSFASGVTSYSASVASGSATMTVTPTVQDATALVKVNGMVVASGAASGPITLNPGANNIAILVIAQDGTSRTYNVAVTRLVTPPDPPTVPFATAGDTYASISFVPPANDGGSPITGYTVTGHPAGGVDSHAGSTVATHSVSGLTSGTAYNFTVTATNAAGTSVPSVASNTVTPMLSPCTYAVAPVDLPNQPHAGGAASVIVTTPSGCPVSVLSMQTWVSVDSITPSAGTTTVSLRISANSGAPRATSIVLAGRLFLISQQ